MSRHSLLDTFPLSILQRNALHLGERLRACVRRRERAGVSSPHKQLADQPRVLHHAKVVRRLGQAACKRGRVVHVGILEHRHVRVHVEHAGIGVVRDVVRRAVVARLNLARGRDTGRQKLNGAAA